MVVTIATFEDSGEQLEEGMQQAHARRYEALKRRQPGLLGRVEECRVT